MVGAGSEGKHTALEAVTIVLDLPPPQPGSISGLTSIDKVSASDPKSALALQRLVQAAVSNPLYGIFFDFYVTLLLLTSIIV